MYTPTLYINQWRSQKKDRKSNTETRPVAGGKETGGEGMGGTSEEPWWAAAVVAAAVVVVVVVVILVASLGTEGEGTTWAMGASATTTDTVSI